MTITTTRLVDAHTLMGSLLLRLQRANNEVNELGETILYRTQEISRLEEELVGYELPRRYTVAFDPALTNETKRAVALEQHLFELKQVDAGYADRLKTRRSARETCKRLEVGKADCERQIIAIKLAIAYVMTLIEKGYGSVSPEAQVTIERLLSEFDQDMHKPDLSEGSNEN